MTITVTVTDRIATISATERIVAGNTYPVALSLDSEWTGPLFMRVRFGSLYYDIPFASSDTAVNVQMPVGYPEVGIGVFSEALEICTNEVRVRLLRSILEAGEQVVEFDSDLYDQWVEETSELLTDQTYDPASAKAQSGTAIAGLDATLLHKAGDETKSGTLYFGTAYPKMVQAGMESPVPVYALPTFGVISDTTGQVNNLVHTLGSESVGGVKTLTSEAHAMVGLNTTVTSSAKLMLTLSGLTSETGVVWMRIMSNTVIGDVRVSASRNGVIGFAVYNQAGTTLNSITLSAAVNGTTLEIYARRTNTAPIMIQVLMASVQGGGKSVPANITWVATAHAVPEGATEVTL